MSIPIRKAECACDLENRQRDAEELEDDSRQAKMERTIKQVIAARRAIRRRSPGSCAPSSRGKSGIGGEGVTGKTPS